MAEVKLTKAQQAVVDDRGGALLVSAAAGSGKTKVLVDRLMSRICDPVQPCNVDDFLIITYTNAAAAELRMKIAQELSRRLAMQPQNRHLQQQMRRIYLAQISTVHAFCSDLLRDYAHILDIPGDFRMIEEAEAQTLQQKVLDALLEQGYAAGSDDFSVMVDSFGYGRDDRRLAEAVLMADKAMRCRADMKQWVDQTLGTLDMERYDDVAQTPWGAYVLEEFRVFLSRQIELLREAVNQMQRYPNICAAYGAVFEENILQMRELLALETWDEIVDGQIDSFGRLKPVREPEDVSVKERMSQLRKKCWSDLQKWQQLFYAHSAELLEDLAQVMPGACALIRFTVDFDKAYTREKQRRKLLDFSDLEHLAIRLLTDRYTGKPTAEAREISQRYVEIMVDEYQDSNQVQEVIFEAVSKEGKNRFMVGDVKQSIYRFRLADPTLFLRKYEEYPDYETAQQGQPRKILLSENFRSRPEILSACNDVFRLIMRKQVGDLNYGEAEELRPGRVFPALPHIPVELHCLTSSEEETGQDKRELEAEFVADRIAAMLCDGTQVTDGDSLRPVRAGDIVILMRSVSNNAGIYMQALERRGITAVCNQGGNLLDTTEVQILIAMLQLIDDPHQDIPLLTVLASPVFGFSPQQLAQVRTNNKKDDLYNAICEWGGEYEPFLKQLNGLREDADWVPVYELVDRVLHETKLYAVFSAMADGAHRERNLLAFSSFALSFEKNGNRNLPQLLWYLSNLQASGGQLPVPQEAAENAVTIMSIHKSKGLEFPVVFLCDLSRQFNMKDMQEAILVDDTLAVGCNRVDMQRYVRYPTLAKKSIERKKRQESISEELRVLYVAMTRPKDMLVMTYYSKRLDSELQAINSQLTRPLSDELCASVSNPGKWILMAALCRTEAGALFSVAGNNDVSSVSQMPWKIEYHDLFAREEDTPISSQSHNVSASGDGATEMVQGEYAYLAVSAVPAKLTATQLKGRTQDQEAAEGAAELSRSKSYSFRKASFLPRALTAAEKGTATHLFMQFANYEACCGEQMISVELDRLIEAQFLTPEQAEAVQIEKISAFFRSQIGQWLLSCKDLKREFKFSVLVPAQEYLPQAAGEEVLLQGVVDCFVSEEDGLTILDFKTDRVEENVAERAEYYRPQLEAYAKALAEIYEKPVKRKILYFFHTGQVVEL